MSLAQEPSLLCSDVYNKSPFAYLHSDRGKVVVYTTPTKYTPVPEDLVCAVIKQFWAHSQLFPPKLTIMVVRGDYMNAMILQVNMKNNIMILPPVDIPYNANPPVVKTVWTLFPDPMKRITEMIRLGTMPLVNKDSVKANYVEVSQKDLVYLAWGHSDDPRAKMTIESNGAK